MPIKIQESARISIFLLIVIVTNRPTYRLKNIWRNSNIFSRSSVKSGICPIRDRKMAENLEKWTFTLTWVVLIHALNWPIDALVNKFKCRSAWFNMSNRMKHQVW